MMKFGGSGVQSLIQYGQWLALWGAAACGGYSGLPNPTGTDGDVPGVDADMSGIDAPPGGLQPPSCIGLDPTCGGSGTGSCCPAMTVEGGVFLRGYDAAPDLYNNSNYPATVSSFVLDKYEITVGRFRKFVEAGGGTQANPPAAGAGAHPKLPGSGWDSYWNTSLVADTAMLKALLKPDPTSQMWTDTPGTHENKPINYVTWYEAMAFCIWDGGYLPTEAEWNYAATGGASQRAYPWSSPAGSTTIDCSYADYFINNPVGTYCPSGTTGAVFRVGSRSPKGDGRWGHSDMAGNVHEWALDWYATSYPYPQQCNDCASLTLAAYRVIRGGSYGDVNVDQRAAFRDYRGPSSRGHALGFRCARTL